MARRSKRGQAALVAAALAAAAALSGCGGGGSNAAAEAQGKADNTIRVGVGIAGVKIGMTEGQVRDVLDAPKSVSRRTAAFGPGRLVTFHYSKLGVLFWKGAPRTPSGSKPPDRKLRVASVNTTRDTASTSNGAGVGSTEKQVKKKVSGVACENLQWGGRTWRNCHVGSYQCKPPSWTLGDLPCRVSAFVLDQGRVFRVAVGWLGNPAGDLG